MPTTLAHKDGYAFANKTYDGGLVPASDGGPSESAAAVTPSDTVNFTATTRRLFCASAGTVVAIIGGSAITFTVTAGTILPIACTRVNATGTSPLTGIVALF